MTFSIFKHGTQCNNTLKTSLGTIIVQSFLNLKSYHVKNVQSDLLSSSHRPEDGTTSRSKVTFCTVSSVQSFQNRQSYRFKLVQPSLFYLIVMKINESQCQKLLFDRDQDHVHVQFLQLSPAMAQEVVLVSTWILVWNLQSLLCHS